MDQYHQIRSIDSVSNTNVYDNRIREAYNSLRHKYTVNELRKIKIDALADKSTGYIPVHLLYSVGFNSVGKLDRASNNHLMRIKGIGKVYAARILEAYQTYYKEVSDAYQLILYPDYNYVEILKNLFLRSYYIKNEEVITGINKELKRLRLKSDSLFVDGKRFGNLWKWLFNRRKEKVQKVYDDLVEFYIGDIASSYQSIYDDMSSVDVFEHFKRHASDYYSALDVLGIGVPEVFAQDVFTEEFVKEIESVHLNLDGLKVEPRTYQLFAGKFGILQKNIFLGDEMGLGKTIEALLILTHLNNINKKRFIVICSLSLMINWEREIKARTSLKVHIYHGHYREVVYKTWSRNGGVLLTTYDTGKNLMGDKNISIDALIIDEAHTIKNENSKRHHAAAYLIKRAEYNILMSGTPIENNEYEFVTLLRLLRPELERDMLKQLKKRDVISFKHLISVVYLRRNIDEVLNEIPTKEERESWVSFTDEELSLYKESLFNTHIMQLRQIGWRYGSRSSKMGALKNICARAKADNRKVVIFSFFRSVLKTVYENLDGNVLLPIDGDVKQKDRQRIIDEFNETSGHAILIAQIETMGQGQNLQAASVGVICEPQFKPTTEQQAIARLHRMGQTKNVLIYRLYNTNSIDELLYDELHVKQNIFDTYAKDSHLASLSENARLNGTFHKSLQNHRNEILSAQDKKKIYEVSKEKLFEYKNLLDLTYDEALEKMRDKYGNVTEDFFNENSYNRFISDKNRGLNANPTTQFENGLERHHIKEDEYENMGNKRYVKNNNIPFKYQTKEYLVYCNLIEHAILHVLIAKETNNKFGLSGYNTYLRKLIYDWYVLENVATGTDSYKYAAAFLIRKHAEDLLKRMDQMIKIKNSFI